MKRTIIKIDQEKCIGCGLCANACSQEAIAVVDGKAQLVREDYCDGLGKCLPACPQDAISLIEKELDLSEEKNCPGRQARRLAKPSSELRQWPIQIQLVPDNAAYFAEADLLISADCAAYAYGNFHSEFIKDKITLIGCPKLDITDYSEKLTEIFRANNIKSLTVVRMEVPCCAEIERAAKKAMKNSGKNFPLLVVTVSADGRII